jgi:hypothetical protein
VRGSSFLTQYCTTQQTTHNKNVSCHDVIHEETNARKMHTGTYRQHCQLQSIHPVHACINGRHAAAARLKKRQKKRRTSLCMMRGHSMSVLLLNSSRSGTCMTSSTTQAPEANQLCYMQGGIHSTKISCTPNANKMTAPRIPRVRNLPVGCCLLHYTQRRTGSERRSIADKRTRCCHCLTSVQADAVSKA